MINEKRNYEKVIKMILKISLISLVLIASVNNNVLASTGSTSGIMGSPLFKIVVFILGLVVLVSTLYTASQNEDEYSIETIERLKEANKKKKIQEQEQNNYSKNNKWTEEKAYEMLEKRREQIEEENLSKIREQLIQEKQEQKTKYEQILEEISKEKGLETEELNTVGSNESNKKTESTENTIDHVTDNSGIEDAINQIKSFGENKNVVEEKKTENKIENIEEKKEEKTLDNKPKVKPKQIDIPVYEELDADVLLQLSSLAKEKKEEKNSNKTTEEN